MPYRDVVQAYKDESAAGGGSAGDAEAFPTVLTPTQDALEAAGLVIDDWNGGVPTRDQNVTVTRTGNDLIFKDVTNGSLPLSLLTTDLDFLLDSDPVGVGVGLVITRTSGLVSNLTWKVTATAKNIKTVDFTRTSGRIATVVTKVYASDGTTIIAQKTETLTRTSGIVTSETVTRDV